ncbi:MAG: hypothetical protein RIS21_1301 [Planctomycetota bacterium]
MAHHRTKSVIGAALLVAGSLLAQEPPRLPSFDRRTPVVIAVENVGPAVVNVRAQEYVAQRRSTFLGKFFASPEEIETTPDGRRAATRSLGSGVIIHPDGYVLTNDHVIDGAQRITLQMKSVAGGATLEADVVSSNPDNDLALLRIKGTPGPFPYALLGDSDAAFVGETVLALGNPLGLASTVTSGILSAKNREVRFEGKPVFQDFLQIDSPIYPGSSGGPLLDINGRVIGINTAVRSGAEGGIGFAIPSNRVRELVSQLLDPQMLGHSRLGCEFEALSNGVRVARLDADGPAARAGLAVGDVVTSVDRAPLRDGIDFFARWLKRNPATPADLDIVRNGRISSVSIKPSVMSASDLGGEEIASLGFRVADLSPPLARRFGLPSTEQGVVVTEVGTGTIAAKLALKPGDQLMQLGRYRIRTADEFTKLLQAYGRTATTVQIRILRNGESFSGNVPLGGVTEKSESGAKNAPQ